MNETYTIAGILITAGLGMLTAEWVVLIWLNRQFSNLKAVFYAEMKELQSNIMNKLEYHEKHDDTRFDQVFNRFGEMRDSLWEIKVRNAARDKIISAEKNNHKG